MSKGASKYPKKLLLKGHQAEVSDVAVSPDGTRLASVDWQGRLLVWQPWEPEPVFEKKTSKLRNQSVVFISNHVSRGMASFG